MTSLEARNQAFYLDGEEVMLLSGAMHYFRVVPEYWKDRMMRMKACGLNTLETYVPWNLHEEVRGEFNFSGILDLRKYLETAQEVGLHVLFRPGPYICSEWDFGGLPSWLLSDPNMRVRTSYKPYLDAVDKYFSKLLPLVADLQHSCGGPIIAVQLENEYGAYGDDMEYKLFLKQCVTKYGINELLFTSDGMGFQEGSVPDVLVTVNFQAREKGAEYFKHLRDVKQPDKPLMVMEFWTGWFDHWGDKHEIWPTESFRETLAWILQQKSSVNFYMMHGGTNFGFMNGANQDVGATDTGIEPYAADVTSYDYDAPIAENGDIKPKAHTIKELFTTLTKAYVPEKLPAFPENIPSEAYGDITVVEHMVFNDILSHIQPVNTKKPVAMEMLDINNGGGQGYGFILYQTDIQLGQHSLKFTGIVQDRTQVLLDNKAVDQFDMSSKDHTTVLPSTSQTSRLGILVENLGRVNYTSFKNNRMNIQRKGIHNDLLIDGDSIMQDWNIYPLEFKPKFIESVSSSACWKNGSPSECPSLCRLNLHINDQPADTYINMKAWTKGVVFINGFNLGRYWNIGPQETLYIPGPLLKQGDNQILVFELHQAAGSVRCEAEPALGETVIHVDE